MSRHVAGPFGRVGTGLALDQGPTVVAPTPNFRCIIAVIVVLIGLVSSFPVVLLDMGCQTKVVCGQVLTQVALVIVSGLFVLLLLELECHFDTLLLSNVAVASFCLNDNMKVMSYRFLNFDIYKLYLQPQIWNLLGNPSIGGNQRPEE